MNVTHGGSSYAFITIYIFEVPMLHVGGPRGVMVIVLGNGHGDTSSNPGRD